MTPKQIRHLYCDRYGKLIDEWDQLHPKEAAAGKPWPQSLWKEAMRQVNEENAVRAIAPRTGMKHYVTRTDRGTHEFRAASEENARKQAARVVGKKAAALLTFRVVEPRAIMYAV